MAKVLKRKQSEQDYINYGKGDPLLDLLRVYLINDMNSWKCVVENDKKCQRERLQRDINHQKRYKL